MVLKIEMFLSFYFILGYTTVPDGLGCHGKDILCRSSRTWQAVCLSEKYICDGNKDCFSGEDEDESICSKLTLI